MRIFRIAVVVHRKLSDGARCYDWIETIQAAPVVEHRKPIDGRVHADTVGQSRGGATYARKIGALMVIVDLTDRWHYVCPQERGYKGDRAMPLWSSST